jgi:GNAT superfamily N-acetyltransferase
MSSENIEIKPVMLKDLYQFARGFTDSSGFERIAPITVSRAKAQMKNPYAKPDDIVLFVALKNNQVIGYIGRFPGILSFESKHYRVFWGSTFYLMAKYRGKGIGKQLLDKMILLDQDFVVTRITPQADKVLKCYGMKVLGSLKYFQFRVERVHFFKGLFKAFKNIEKVFGGNNQWGKDLINKVENGFYKLEKRFFYAATAGLVNNMAGNYKVWITNKIKESDFFQQQQTHQPFFYRGPELINWMLQERWVLSQCNKMPDISGYYFSDIRELFTFITLKLYYKNQQNYSGFIILCVSSHKGKTVLKVLDHLLKTTDVIPAACATVLKYARQYQADRVEFSDKMGCYLKRRLFFKKFLKKQQREYLYFPAHENSPLERVRKKIRFDYCDGDTAFT